MRFAAVAAGVVLFGGALPAWGQTVSVRGMAPGPIPGQVTHIDLNGVTVSVRSLDPAGAEQLAVTLVSLDRVRSLDSYPLSPAVEQSLRVGTCLMRVRARLERGDFELAESLLQDPVLANLHPLPPGATVDGPGQQVISGPTGLLLAELRLRGQLARNAAGAAALSWLQHRAISINTPEQNKSAVRWFGGTTSLPPIVDAATGLCPQIPPIFPRFPGIPGADAARLRPLLDSPQMRAVGEAGELSPTIPAAYALAARIASGTLSDQDTVVLPQPSQLSTDQLVHDIVAAQTAPGDEMRAARARLSARLAQMNREELTRESQDELASDQPVGGGVWWQRAWLHAAIGRSLLAEADVSMQRQGVVELLHVPALHAQTLPQLSATALLDVLNHFRAGGVGASAAAERAIEHQLKTVFSIDPGSVSPSSRPASDPEPANTSSRRSTSRFHSGKEST